ncbi:MAG TPA: gliding motility protein GldL [Bacteroidia bacterium]|jgi:gliding motility-associated protein GldL|nr:gliding motility protein GldL [Bacteroidia bacterium]
MSYKLPKVKGFKKFLHLSSCLGASVVILGALFKIMHWPGSGPMLILGLGTEAFLFALFASDIPHEEYDWSLAYPELGGMAVEGGEEGSDLPISNQLDNLLEDAKIGPELIQSLSKGMHSLSDTAGKMSDISNATVATNEYVDSVKSASKSVTDLAGTYRNAASTMESLASANDAGTSIGESLNKVSKNLGALNATYELQLQGSKEHLDATNKFYDGLNDLMKNLHDSVDDTKIYRQEMSKLSSNLTSLNQIYGNMLSAMKA